MKKFEIEVHKELTEESHKMVIEASSWEIADKFANLLAGQFEPTEEYDYKNGCIRTAYWSGLAEELKNA